MPPAVCTFTCFSNGLLSVLTTWKKTSRSSPVESYRTMWTSAAGNSSRRRCLTVTTISLGAPLASWRANTLIVSGSFVGTPRCGARRDLEAAVTVELGDLHPRRCGLAEVVLREERVRREIVLRIVGTIGVDLAGDVDAEVGRGVIRLQQRAADAVDRRAQASRHCQAGPGP